VSHIVISSVDGYSHRDIPLSSYHYLQTHLNFDQPPSHLNIMCNCACGDESMHFFARCGCPNDKPAGDPMAGADDAFHRKWCATCRVFCVQPLRCRLMQFARNTSGHHHHPDGGGRKRGGDAALAWAMDRYYDALVCASFIPILLAFLIIDMVCYSGMSESHRPWLPRS
jgi:hypothetical protein